MSNIFYFNMTARILAGNDINFAIAATLMLHMPGVK